MPPYPTHDPHLGPIVPDDELVERARSGDAEAFGLLFERHAPVVRAYAVRLGGAATADDLTADAFTRTWQQLRAGAGPSRAFLAYVRTAVRNGHISRLHRDHRFTWVADLDEVAAADPALYAQLVAASPEQDVLERLVNEAVLVALHRLPRRWQEVLRLVYLDDLPYETVAARMALTVPAARQLAQRARQGIRAELVYDARPTRHRHPIRSRGYGVGDPPSESALSSAAAT